MMFHQSSYCFMIYTIVMLIKTMFAVLSKNKICDRRTKSRLPTLVKDARLRVIIESGDAREGRGQAKIPIESKYRAMR